MSKNILEKVTDPTELLKKYWGHDEFRPLQEKIVNNILSKNDSMVLLPTGGGKSLCFQLPALVFEGLTLVISPLIALMKDQVDALSSKDIPAAYLNSSLSQDESSEIKSALKKDQVKLLYIAPERYKFESFQNFLKKLNISLIAIDEAHCISDWGHEFRPAYRELKTLKKDFPKIPIVALTATATVAVREDIIEQLHLKNTKTFVSSFNRPNLTYEIREKHASFNPLLRILKNQQSGSIIIYRSRRAETEQLADYLNDKGYGAAAYHAGLDTEERKQILEEFLSEKITIIVATIAFGMGIDKSNIRLVVHHDLPKSIEGYFQETGRAGRDGMPSKCILFFSRKDDETQKYFISQMENPVEQKKAYSRLNDIVGYCETKLCRRMFLLSYFGENYEKDNCANCDNCNTQTKKHFDATTITNKIIETADSTKGNFGITHTVSILLGDRTKQVAKYGHDQLSVFGVVNDYSGHEIKSIIKDLIAKNYLLNSGGRYPKLSVGKQGAEFQESNSKLLLPSGKRTIKANEKPRYIKRKRRRSKNSTDAFWWENN